MSATRAVVRGATASGIGALLGFVVRFGANAWMARMIAPVAVGEFAMAWVYNEFLSVVLAGCFANCIVQFPDEHGATEAATLRLNAAASLLLILGSTLCALWVGQSSPTLGSLVIALGVARALTTSLGVYDAVLQRDMRFTDLARYRFYGTAGSVVVAVVLAAFGHPYLALFARDLLGACAPALCSVRSVRVPFMRAVRPDASVEAMTKRAFRLGVEQFWVQALEIAYQRADQFLLGKLLGAVELGFYTQARYLAGLPHAAVVPATQTVTLRVFAGSAADPARLRGMLEAIQTVVAHTLVLAAIPVAAMPELLLSWAFGERWLPAAPALLLLAPWVVLLPLLRNAQTVLMALFRWRALRASQVAQLVAVAMTLPFAVWQWGAMGAALSLSIALLAAATVVLAAFTHAERPRWRSYRGLVVGLLALAVWASVSRGSPSSGIADNLVRVGGAELVYVGAVLLTDYRELRALVRRLLGALVAPRV